MTAPYRMFAAVGLVAALLGSPALLALAASPLPAAVAVSDSLRGYRLVDPRTGEEIWQAGGDHDDVANLIVGPDGRAYASFVEANGAATAVYAVAPGAADSEPVGQVAGRAVAAAVAPADGQIRLLALPPPTSEDFLPPPVGVRNLPLPDGTTTSDLAPAAGRDEGFGILSSDGGRWYGILPADDGWNAPAELVVLSFRNGDPAQRASLQLPGLSGYRSLLLAPDGRTLYVVDYYAQAIQVVSGSPLAVQDVVGFGRYVTKRATCAAALSPRGDRLYVLGNSGSTNAGDGILAFETESWRLMGHYLPGRDFYCLAVSPDGTTVYASSSEAAPTADDPWLVTIDAATGLEQDSVPLNLGDYFTAVGPVAGGPPSAAPTDRPAVA